MRIEELTGEVVNKAVSVYLVHAYGDPDQRERHRVSIAPGARGIEALQKFDDLTDGAAGTLRVYALRLGNQTYPHMKLTVVEAYFAGEFVFAVDRHDTFHFEPDVPGYRAWCELKEINRFVKQAIEDAWYRAGLDTLRSLRETRFGPGEVLATMEGQRILVLDDDEHRAAIIAGLLGVAGYDTFRAGALDNVPAAVEREKVALIVMDVSYHTSQGPRIAEELKMDARTQSVPILAVYSRRDFGPDPEIFDAAIRRPFEGARLVRLVEWTIIQRDGAAPRILK